MADVLVLNGPNLGMLGAREPEIYGKESLDDLRALLETHAAPGQRVDVRQTDDEAELIRWLHDAYTSQTDVILNPAAFTHYSYGLRDAAAIHVSSGAQLVEVHITNPHTRETFRHTSVISGVASGVIAGFGLQSYVLALRSLA